MNKHVQAGRFLTVIGIIVLALVIIILVWAVTPTMQSVPPSAQATELTYANRALLETPTVPIMPTMPNARWLHVNGENWRNGDCNYESVVCDDNLVVSYKSGYIDGPSDACDGCKHILAVSSMTEIVYSVSTVTPLAVPSQTLTTEPTETATQEPELLQVKITGEYVSRDRGLNVRNCGASLYNNCTAFFAIPHCDYQPDISWCTNETVPVYEIKYKAYSVARPADAGWWLNIICHWDDPNCSGNYWIPGCLEDGRCFTNWRP